MGAQRLFGALKTANIGVLFIAQASSEHSICFAIRSSSAKQAQQAVEEAFFYELKSNMINAIEVINDCSMIAAVGESMSNAFGVSGVFFDALGKARISVLAISQGCDEKNISAVVHGKDSGRALKAVHAAFWLSSQVLTIGVIGGTGKVGSCLLQTILDTREMLKERFDIDLQVRGVCGRKKMLLSDNLNETLRDSLIALDTANNSTSPFNELRKHLSSGSFKSSERLSDLCENENVSAATQQPSLRKIDSKLSLDQLDLYKFFEYITMSPSPHIIMIDTTDSPDVAKRHPAWLRGGAHVITSSKRALSTSLDLYNEIIDARKANNRAYLSEVTIGASVPVITTLSDMLYSGDAVHSIVGIMSVSAGRIMTAMCEEGMSFSKALALTYEQELFEEDVFTDLEGLESAYKVLILARTMGYPLNLKDID